MKKRIVSVLVAFTIVLSSGISLSAFANTDGEVEPMGQSGDLTIRTADLVWIRGSESSEISGDKLTITPPINDKDKSFAVYQIEFSTGGKDNVQPGQAEIRIPAHIFYNREGKPVGNVKLPLPKHL